MRNKNRCAVEGIITTGTSHKHECVWKVLTVPKYFTGLEHITVHIFVLFECAQQAESIRTEQNTFEKRVTRGTVLTPWCHADGASQQKPSQQRQFVCSCMDRIAEHDKEKHLHHTRCRPRR